MTPQAPVITYRLKNNENKFTFLILRVNFIIQTDIFFQYGKSFQYIYQLQLLQNKTKKEFQISKERIKAVVHVRSTNIKFQVLFSDISLCDQKKYPIIALFLQ